MTRIYQRKFRVRGYEVGANNCVHDSVFLNYVQQAAFEASADAGYDTRRYDALGTIWVIRRQSIAFLAPLSYNDAIVANTWVSDVRRVRSHRETELRRLEGDSVVALARTDWVYIDAVTLFPRRISSDVIEAFEPNGQIALDKAPPMETLRPVAGRQFVAQHRAKRYELDNLQHVNNANYLNWLYQARADALADVGFPFDASSTQLVGLGLTPSPIRYEIEYFQPVTGGQRVELCSQVIGVGETQLHWRHEIRRGETRLVEAGATICLTDKTGNGVSLPADVLAALLDS
jgi:acyl-CoA thioester hydrolase